MISSVIGNDDKRRHAALVGQRDRLLFIRCEKPRRHVIHGGSLVRKMPSGFVKGGSHWRKNCIEFNAIFNSMQSSTSDQGLECLR
jgi:hypothetical protein